MDRTNGREPINGPESFYRRNALTKLLDLPEVVAEQGAKIVALEKELGEHLEDLEKQTGRRRAIATALYLAMLGSFLGYVASHLPAP